MDAVDLENVSSGLFYFSWANLSPCDRAKIMADSPKTVWIFGAGASHHYDLNARRIAVPLANDFFYAFNNLPTSEGLHARVGPLISFLNHSRGVNPLEVAQWSENIEDFMTSVENEINELREIANKRKLNGDEYEKSVALSEVFNNMNFIFANVMNEAQNGPSESLYKYLLDFCGPNDTFITFNWDTLLDRALADTGGWSPNNGYGISFYKVFDSNWKQAIEFSSIFQHNWKLLKLHGSTNWLVPYTGFHLQTLEYIPFVPESEKVFLYWQSTLPYETHRNRWRGGYASTCYGYYPPNLPIEAFSEKQLSPEPDHLWAKTILVGIFSPFREPSADGIPSSPLLITPVRQKRYDMYQSTIESLWKQSYDEIRATDKIVIIGYSFPPTDKRPLELLKNSLDSREGEIIVEIVSPSADDIVARIGTEYLSKAKDVIPRPMKFEEYLEVLSKNIPELMKRAAKKNEEVGAWLERLYIMGQIALEKY